VNEKKYARIIGTGSYLPNKILTNADFERMVDTSDEWIMERVGIKKRHVLSNNEVASDMIEAAAKKAIEAANINQDEIDLIIVATITSEYITPSAACVLQKRLGIKGCPAFDINAACSGFIYGLDIINQYVKNGAAKCVLLVASEALSTIVDYSDRATCVLFGDGAGAAILKADNAPGLRYTKIEADGSFLPQMYAPSSLYFDQKPYIRMRGNELFREAVAKLCCSINDMLKENKITTDDVDWVIPHQANLRIITATAKRTNTPMERIIITIQNQGNTSSSSVPLALDIAIRDGRIKSGDTVFLEAFGAGIVWGGVLLDF
jgi:3-oxoacyl-[acyl-carrier-protein] synthase-3